MILLSGTHVLSLIVGAYTYGLMRPNVERVFLTSALLFAGVSTDNSSVRATSDLVLGLRNSGLATNITSIALSGASLSSTITEWAVTPTQQSGNSFRVSGNNKIPGGQSAYFTYYPVGSSSVTIPMGQTFQYEIDFSNGQSISGSLLAQ